MGLCVAGAMFASLEIVGARSLLRDQYTKGVPISDWCDVSDSKDNTDSAK